MKIYGFLLLIVALSLRAADNTTVSLEKTQIDPLRKQCTLVAIDAFLLDLRKAGIKTDSLEQKAYESLLSERNKLEKNAWHDINDPAIKTMLAGDDYKEKIKLLYQKYASPAPQRRVSAHIPLDSNPAAMDLAREIKANKEIVIKLYQELFPNK